MTKNAEPKSIQWAPSGAPLDGVPGPIVRLLAREDGYTYGYGYGPGWSMVFGSEMGDITIYPGQWVTRYPDGRIAVTEDAPVSAPKGSSEETP